MPQTEMIEDPPFLDDEERDAIRAADDSLGHRGGAAHDKDFAARKDRIEASAPRDPDPEKTEPAAMTLTNRQWLLAERPVGAFDENTFRLVESPVPVPGEGEFLVRNIWLSVDPYMRGRMNAGKSYARPVEVGAVMEGGTVGEVIASHHPDFAVGDIVDERLGWQEYAVTRGRGARKIDPSLAPISTAVGVLGMPGMTAYFGTRGGHGRQRGRHGRRVCRFRGGRRVGWPDRPDRGGRPGRRHRRR